MCFKEHKYKTVCFFVFFFAVLAALFFRLVFVQIIRHDEFEKLAKQQHNIIIEIPQARGCIYDRCLRPLAQNLPVSSLYASPRMMSDKNVLVPQLAGILNLKQEDIENTLKKDKGFVWVKRFLNPDEASKIKELNVDTLGLVKESRRVYYNGPLASQLVGCTDIDNNGLEGLELYYNDYLKGTPGRRYATRDAASKDIISWDDKYVSPKDGYDLVLTIDQVVQHTAEKYLSEACQKYNAAGGVVVVMTPATGEVLAMANYPSCDPANRSKEDAALWKNKAITDFFEPGSVFKIVTASAAVEERTVSLKDRIYCEDGAYRVGKRVLHDAHPNKWLTFPEVIQKSSNIGTVKIAQRLGERNLYKYTKNFGFGQITGIDLPGEVSGRVRPLNKWSKIDITSLPMGQGVGISALQLACGLNLIANKGVLLKPHVVKYICHKSGQIIEEFNPVTVRRVISARTADTVKDILVGVLESGTGTSARIEGIKIAGKTGTAQKVDPGGTYSHSRFTASFIGFLPADNPVISIVVIMDEPRPLYYGGTVSAPVFKNIASDLMGYFGLTPDNERTFVASRAN